MSLTEHDVLHIAQLARVALDQSDANRYGVQLESILERARALQELPQPDGEEMPSTLLKNRYRSDRAQPCDDAVRDAIISAFPRGRDGWCVVPAVMDK